MTDLLSSSWLDDRPEQRDDQLWGRLNSLAESLTRELPQLPASAPVLISGDWGSGKTTLLHATERRLQKKGVPVVWFEAWRHEGEILLLPALVRAIWQAAPKEYRENEDAKKNRDRLWQAAVAVCTGMGSTLAGMLGPWGTALWGGLEAAYKNEKEVLSSPDKDATEELWKGFQNLVNSAWPSEKSKPLIILVDDLDRCSPTGSVSLLDSIRMLVHRADQVNCRFVVALDRTVLAQAVARKFSDISQYEGNRYLEKIFPVSFDLPRLDEEAIGDFVHRLIEHLTKDRARQREVLSLALSDPIFANPRLMKRCINRFLLLRSFEETDAARQSLRGRQETEEEEQRRQVILVRWMAATERWPALRRLLSRRPPEYWHQIHAALSNPETRLPDAEAEILLREQDIQLWLRRELLGGKGSQIESYREADERLRRWGL